MDNCIYRLVEESISRCSIVARKDGFGLEAEEELRNAIRQSSGVTIGTIYEVDSNVATTDDLILIHFMQGHELEAVGLTDAPLSIESYRIVTHGSRLIFCADTELALIYAVSDFLDRYLGVRWLWPGELGTYVPKHNTIELSAVDWTSRPVLEHRKLRSAKNSPEVARWNAVHRMGNRSQFKFGHAFSHWWERYGESHPEYFAHPPAGQEQVILERIKLDISNTAIDEVIIKEWTEAGCPNNWNVSPNDGIGFCVSPGCLEMDEITHPDVQEVWKGSVNLTTRYVKFWNRLLAKMKLINPAVTLSTYAYSCYREPPVAPLKLVDGVVVGIVHSWQAYEQWKGWHEAGAKLYLRPNWWHYGAVAPHLMLQATGEYFKFAYENGMLGFDFDSIMGQWGTQGVNYYLIARLSVRPELTVENVIAEYCSAFGDASSIIREYIQFWERFSEEAAYNVVARKAVPGSVEGEFERLVEMHDLPSTPTGAGWFILPYIMTDDVLQAAYAILDRAASVVSHTGNEKAVDREVWDRIEFLRDGLRHVELTRDVIRLGYEKSRPEDATYEHYLQLRQQLDQFRVELDARNVVWKDFTDLQEARRNVPTHESRTTGWDQKKRVDPSGKEVDTINLGLF